MNEGHSFYIRVIGIYTQKIIDGDLYLYNIPKYEYITDNDTSKHLLLILV